MLLRKLVFFTFLLFFTYRITAQDNDSLLIKEQIPIVNNQEKEKNSFNSSVFTQYWNNKNIFPYSYPVKADIPDTVAITLVDSAHTFVMPRSGRLNSGYGPRENEVHKGLDIYLRKGDNVFAAFDGKVRYAEFNTSGYGNLVIIRHLNGLETYYAHLSKILVKENQIVKAGKIIGTGGNTGASWTGEHLHFEMRYMDKTFNPLLVINLDSFKLMRPNILLTKEDFKLNEISNYRNKKLKSGYSGNIAPTTRYVVKKNDTLAKIAQKHHTTVNALCKLNKLTKKSKLKVGQTIKVR